MSFTSGYLTDSQLRIWAESRRERKQIIIARRLGISRQAVHKTLALIEGKIERALHEAAKTNRIQVERVIPSRGLLVGFSPEFRAPVVISFTAKNGIQFWYRTRQDCKDCPQLEKCRRMVLHEAVERDVQLTKEERNLHPAKMADLVFSRILQQTE